MKIKGEKGITLIILIVTIVIMLILGGTVVINLLGYEDIKGLSSLINDLELVRENVEIYYEKNNKLPVSTEITEDMVTLLGESRSENDGEKYYKIDLGLLETTVLTYGTGKNQNDYFIINEESHNVYYYSGIEVDGITYYGIKDVSSIENMTQFGIETFELKTRTNATVSEGVLDIQLEVYADIENTDGLKYMFKINDEDWTLEQAESTYTFHNLKQYETYEVSMLIIDNSNNEIYATNNETEVIIKELPVNLTIDGKLSGSYNNPLIPAGFIAINQNNAVWQSSDGYKNGLVVKEVSTGNEFVWVPVDGTTIKFERTNFEKGTVTYDTCTETVPTELTTSVTNNGGFYIARYEAGKELVNDVEVLVSKRNATVWNNINLSTAQTKAEGLYNTDTSGIVSTLIYGTQWDAALNFISAYNGDTEYLTDSTGKGNYSGTEETDTIEETPAVTGALDVFSKKNIFDMAGNVSEWTMEKNDVYSIVRGGNYSGTGAELSSAYRDALETTETAENIGFRIALYIK